MFTGDTGPDPAVNALARNADILVSEVYLPRPGAEERSASAVGRELAEHMSQEHLSPAGVGKLAQGAQVRKLVLTHLAMPAGPDVERRLIEGVRQFYTGPVAVGDDLLAVEF